jgi:phthiocerol/phenolphthiocerol synthesis type-I polyketide synthase E
LLNKVRQATGRTVSVAEFSADATFGQLVRLVEPGQPADAHAAAEPAGVVTLRDGGPLRPLFLAADALGTTFGYRVLASLLDDQRPVYGLEPVDPDPVGPRPVDPDPVGPGPAGDAAAGDRIERIAAQHIKAMLAAQPSGPYTIGGWSFGAVVAHEMAHQLALRGDEVGLLVCIDGVVPGGRRLAGFDPGYLLGSVRLQAGAALGVGPVGRLVRRTPELRRSFIANVGALPRYRPQPVPCPAVVFTAGADTRAADRLRSRLSPLYGGGVQVHPVGGDHWSMLALPHARDLATRLHEALPHGATAVAGQDGRQ